MSGVLPRGSPRITILIPDQRIIDGNDLEDASRRDRSWALAQESTLHTVSRLMLGAVSVIMWSIGLWRLAVSDFTLGSILMVAGGVGMAIAYLVPRRDKGAFTEFVIEFLGEPFGRS